MTGEFLPAGCLSSCLLPYSRHAAAVPTHRPSLRIYALVRQRQQQSNREPVLDPGQMPAGRRSSRTGPLLGAAVAGWASPARRQPRSPPLPHPRLAQPGASSGRGGRTGTREEAGGRRSTSRQLGRGSSQYCYGNRYLVMQVWEMGFVQL